MEPNEMRYTDYVSAMRGARATQGKDGWSQIELSKQMGNSPSWAAMVESRARGMGLDSLVKVADILGLDKRGFIRVYLAEKHPAVYRSLFPDENFEPAVRQAAPGSAIFDLADRLQVLPRELRRAIEATILAAYDATAGRR